MLSRLTTKSLNLLYKALLLSDSFIEQNISIESLVAILSNRKYVPINARKINEIKELKLRQLIVIQFVHLAVMQLNKVISIERPAPANIAI